MKPMNRKVRQEVAQRPQICARHREGTCAGRNTYEHVFGRKNEESWNVIILCAYHHSVDEYQGGDGLNKEINRFYAYQQISDEELRKKKLGKIYLQEKRYLQQKYDKGI